MNAVRRAARAIAIAYDPGASPSGRTTGRPRTRPSPMLTSMLPALCVPPLDLDETDGIAKRLSPHL